MIIRNDEMNVPRSNKKRTLYVITKSDYSCQGKRHFIYLANSPVPTIWGPASPHFRNRPDGHGISLFSSSFLV
jgi:hypothetical protein